MSFSASGDQIPMRWVAERDGNITVFTHLKEGNVADGYSFGMVDWESFAGSDPLKMMYAMCVYSGIATLGQGLPDTNTLTVGNSLSARSKCAAAPSRAPSYTEVLLVRMNVISYVSSWFELWGSELAEPTQSYVRDDLLGDIFAFDAQTRSMRGLFDILKGHALSIAERGNTGHVCLDVALAEGSLRSGHPTFTVTAVSSSSL